MKLLFVIKSMDLPGGGAERVIGRISTALARRGHEVTLLSFESANATDFYNVGSEVRRIRLGIGQTKSRSGALTTLRRLAQIRRHARELGPDAAIGFMHSGFIPLLFALAGTGVPIIGSERTAYDHYRTRPVQRLLLRASVPFLKRLTVNGERVRSGFPSAIASGMTVIPNPVPSAVDAADPDGPAMKTLLSVGGMRPEKGHGTLLESFARISGQFPEWRLRIVGDGPLRAELAVQAAQLGLATRVELPGPARAVEREYRDAQLFVLPSHYEAFPNCLAEALAHGLPAVGFADCPGTNALIVPGVNGELASGDDRVNALSNCLARLMASPSLRRSYGASAPATVSAYSLAAVVQSWETLLADAVAPPQTACEPQ